MPQRKRRSSKTTAREQLFSNLRRYIRTEGKRFLDDANITSIGVGYKISGGQRTRTISLQFTVRSKAGDSGVGIESLDTQELPRTIRVSGIDVPTDVLERDFAPSYQAAEAEQLNPRKQRLDPMFPGVSVSHPHGTAGTFGLVVFDRQSGAPCILSNWHVLHGATGQIHDPVVQPGPHDDNDVTENRCGVLLRSHLGEPGDCAIARIEDRNSGLDILELDTRPSSIVRAELGDRVIKSGRTTGVTRGIVRRIDVIAEIHYPGVGPHLIGGFEYGPEPGAPPDFEVSMGGDSGSAVLIARPNGDPTTMLAGVHFAGETVGNPDEHGIACYAHSVFQKLDISLAPVPPAKIESAGGGYRRDFLAQDVRVPWLSDEDYADAFKLEGSHLIPYTHFSVCMSRSRGLARFVAWNVDGGRIKTVSRNDNFRLDPRVSRQFQHGNELYRHNPLDRGHLARRASLAWGSMSEARRANDDSFFFTNIAPQHAAFNQSSRGGIWGNLENAVFEEVAVEDLRISVMAGPVFRADDPVHRGVQIPREFWKVLAYTDSADGRFKARAFLLTQRALISGLEALELDDFRIFQVPLDTLRQQADLRFPGLRAFDAAPEALSIEGVSGSGSGARVIRRMSDLVL